MGNLLTEQEEKLESLPRREKLSQLDYDDRRHGYDYPYRRVDRWLKSKVGKNWNTIVSEFTHADWIPRRHRTASKLAEEVDTNTFMLDGKVAYYHRWSGGKASLVDDLYPYWRSTFLYVHPVTKKLCEVKNKSRKRADNRKWAERNADIIYVLGNYHQLCKVEGIWYEVKGKPYTRMHYRYRDVQYDPRLPMIGEHRTHSFYAEYSFNGEITMKRQLGTDELRLNGLHNDPAEDLKRKRCPKCRNLKCRVPAHRN